MHSPSDRRRRTKSPAESAEPAEPSDTRLADGGWISLVGKGSGFHDCPLCRELASHGEKIEAFVGVNPASLPELMRSGWLDDLIELVGPDATVRLMGHEMEAKPIEVISMAAFLARVGYQ